MSRTIVVVGGGIAGISCVEALIQGHEDKYPRIVLISETRLIKRVVNYEVTGRSIEKFDIIEDDVDTFITQKIPASSSFEHIVGFVKYVDHHQKNIVIDCEASAPQLDRVLKYDTLCLCTGSRPRELKWKKDCIEMNKRIIVIRDTITVEDFQDKLSNCGKLVIVGNGGISLELVSKISDCEKIWIIRDNSIGKPFFDSGAAKFLLDGLGTCSSVMRISIKETDEQISSSDSIASAKSKLVFSDEPTRHRFGPALGPDWLQRLRVQGRQEAIGDLKIFCNDEIVDIEVGSGENYPLLVKTKNGLNIGCDLVATAIGVQPCLLEFINDSLDLDELDGGILVDEQMRTSLPDVYAAGDVISCSRWPQSDLWLQMRLWTQARRMGLYAGRCIIEHSQGRDPSIYFNFDCFTHCTTFFGYKVVLLGQYNAQLIKAEESSKCEILARVVPNKHYVKIVLKNEKIVGAVLIGDSGLEETFENLILDGIDISELKYELLDGSVDVEDYFD